MTNNLHNFIDRKEPRVLQKKKYEDLGFLQVTEIKNLSVEANNNSIDDQPNNNIVRIL